MVIFAFCTVYALSIVCIKQALTYPAAYWVVKFDICHLQKFYLVEYFRGNKLTTNLRKYK
jgi:hypothetical protein